MKKTLTALTIALLMGASVAAMAGDGHKKMMGGLKQDISQMSVSSVQDVQKMPEDTMVSMQGNITKRVKKNKYLFNDNTGEMIVEIEGYAWRGQEVSPTDVVMIVGEIDKDDNVNIVEVDEVMMAPAAQM